MNPVIFSLFYFAGILLVSALWVENTSLLISLRIGAMIAIGAGALIGLLSTETIESKKQASLCLAGLAAWAAFELGFNNGAVVEWVLLSLVSIVAGFYFLKCRIGSRASRTQPIITW